MKNFTKVQIMSLVVGVISAMAGFIATLGQIWGFTEIASQISETCFAVSGFANIVFFGITLRKGQENTLSEEIVVAKVKK